MLCFDADLRSLRRVVNDVFSFDSVLRSDRLEKLWELFSDDCRDDCREL